MSDLPELFTIKETAKYLKMSLAAVYNMVGRGELPTIKCGACIRVKKEDLQKIVGCI